MRRHLPPITLVVLGLCACSSDEQGSVGADDAAGDASVSEDVFFPDVSNDGTTPSGGDSAAGVDGADGTQAGQPDGDASEGPCNTFGCACSSNADCLDELCVEGPDGRVCSSPCVTECPEEGYACVPIVLGGSDPFNACVPQHPNLCKPCRADSECKNELQPNATALCLPAPNPNDGRFCASSCAGGTPCPDGYTCADIPLEGGGSAKQCIPTDGSCECRPAWANMNLVTDCARENATGTCAGERSCGLGGLTACDAPPASAETCDALDNDCNGATDDIEATPCTMPDNGLGACQGTTACQAGEEVCSGQSAATEVCNLFDDDCDGAADDGTCGDGLACTDDVCAAVGECQNPIQAGSCVIAGKCYAENDANPDFPCQRCVPAVSQTSWTGGGDGPSCFIEGQCWPEGAGKGGEPCLRCRPDVSATTWSPADPADAIACDDGNACTSADTCNGGACLGTPYTCDDEKACTDNVCDGAGGCDYPVRAGSCLIDGACYADGARADATTCRVCDDATPTAWSAPATALACDDGEPCTKDDVCAGGTCGGTSYDCDDQTACTIDTCDGAGGCVNAAADNFCVIGDACFAEGAKDPGNACQACKTATSETGWTPFAASEHVACDDGNACTKTDECTAGSCLGAQYSCIDTFACTDDVCDGKGGCTNPVKTGNCLIGGTCYTDGARENTSNCNVCDDATPAAWSPAATALTCNDANACSKNDVCAGFTCAGASYSCDDGAACTLDSCDGGGGCTNTLQAGSCLIGGKCYANGALNPENPCLFCDTAVSPLFWSAKPNGAACDDGDLCSYGDQCSFGSCLAIPYDCIGAGCCVGDGTCTSTPPVGVTEQCKNGVDDDCDGVTDEGEPEVCADSVDNDCDGDTDESANTWGEIFFARSWRENVTTPTVAIYTSNLDGTFEDPKVIVFPTTRRLNIAGVGDFDADRFLDLIVAESVYGNDFDACSVDADCPDPDGVGGPKGERCIGGGCVPYNCKVDGCSGATGTTCIDGNEYSSATTEDYCAPPTRYYLARETCPTGSVGLQELFTLDPGDYVTAIIDVNNDGHLDFVVRKNWATRRGYVMLNNGDPGDIGFTKVEYRADGTTPMLPMPGSAPGQPLSSPCTWVYNISRTSKDLNGDGVVDLLGFCNPNGGSTPPNLWWWKGRGDGSFEPKADLGVSTTGATPFSLQTMNDFNRDGTQDIIGGMDDDGDSGSIWALLHRSGASHNHWAPAYRAFDVMPELMSGEAPGYGGGTSGDFDRDGYADLLVGWAPDIAECQNTQNPACIHAAAAVLRNRTADPCGVGLVCDDAAHQCGSCRGFCPSEWECGVNGCGDACGAGCEANEICQDHVCVQREACVADCSGKTCGDNGCGGVCGICGDGQTCKDGACVAANTCGSCPNDAKCGTDACGMPCVVFEKSYDIATDADPDVNGRGGEAPTNAPPTAPSIRVLPGTPGDTQDLVCTISVPSYDLDPVQYEYRWYRGSNDTVRPSFVGEVSNRPVVPASMTSPGQVWYCEVIATDRLEYSPRVQSATVKIAGGIISVPIDTDSPQ